MDDFFECLELNCVQPAEIVGECEFPGVDFDGSDALFSADKIMCAAGHHYEVINEERTVKRERLV